MLEFGAFSGLRLFSWRRLTCMLSCRRSQSSLALSFAQPLGEDNFSFVIQDASFEGGFAFLIFGLIGRLLFLEIDHDTAFFPREELAHIARAKAGGCIFYSEEIGTSLLF